MFNEDVKFQGEMTIRVKKADGSYKSLWNENKLGKFIRTVFGLDLKGVFFLGFWNCDLVIKNTTTKVGFAVLAGLAGATGSQVAFTYLANGIGTTGATSDDTALESETTTSGLGRAAATVSRVTTTVTNDTLQLLKSWSVSGTKAITEAGAFNDATTGVMAGRQVFSAVNVVSGDTFQLTYKFKFS